MSVEEKQARSVFVGNIPHGTTEEQMKEIFSTVGTVLSFRIVYDRETGNAKGYGFAEYLDVEMSQSAIRNLNGYEFGGRTLRVDKASSQADELRMIHQQTGGAPPVESPYGDNVSPDRAPEAISKAVASLPPEQMFELMKQMKLCIQNNMNEARAMLLNNPQLAYALLQAQVVMRIIEPQTAMALLHRKSDQPPIMVTNTSPIQLQANIMRPPILSQPQPTIITAPGMPLLTPVIQTLPTAMVPGGQSSGNIRVPPPAASSANMPPSSGSSASAQHSSTDPRFQQAPRPSASSNQSSRSAERTNSAAPQAPSAQSNGGGNVTNEDQEKAALIMQVLQLTDDQIAQLPLEQRQSILLLKAQIAQSANGLLQ